MVTPTYSVPLRRLARMYTKNPSVTSMRIANSLLRTPVSPLREVTPGSGSSFARSLVRDTSYLLPRCSRLDLAAAGREHLRGRWGRHQARARPKINYVALLRCKPLRGPLAVPQ